MVCGWIFFVHDFQELKRRENVEMCSYFIGKMDKKIFIQTFSLEMERDNSDVTQKSKRQYYAVGSIGVSHTQ